MTRRIVKNQKLAEKKNMFLYNNIFNISVLKHFKKCPHLWWLICTGPGGEKLQMFHVIIKAACIVSKYNLFKIILDGV